MVPRPGSGRGGVEHDRCRGAAAGTRLVNRYQWEGSDQGKTLQWLRRAALGDGYAMLNLSSQLAVQST